MKAFVFSVITFVSCISFAGAKPFPYVYLGTAEITQGTQTWTELVELNFDVVENPYTAGALVSQIKLMGTKYTVNANLNDNDATFGWNNGNINDYPTYGLEGKIRFSEKSAEGSFFAYTMDDEGHQTVQKRGTIKLILKKYVLVDP